MNKEDIYKIIQEYLSDVPLMLVGTGASIPVGIPGMKELAQYLLDNLEDKYFEDADWIKVSKRLREGEDLEKALTSINLSESLLNDIKRSTWQLISDADLKVFREKVLFGYDLPFSDLIKKLLRTSSNNLNIITTNYDRYIEYCCDRCNAQVDNRYTGMYYKKSKISQLRERNIVNLLKVHGSLDSFVDEKTKESVSIPLQMNIPIGFMPEIITPGTNKYEAILNTTTNRDILHNTDTLIDKANNYLCIGYGFNDSQIQGKIISRIKLGVPIVVVTKKLSDSALDMIVSNSKKHAVVISGGENKTRFIINKSDTTIEGVYWTIEGFNDII